MSRLARMLAGLGSKIYSKNASKLRRHLAKIFRSLKRQRESDWGRSSLIALAVIATPLGIFLSMLLSPALRAQVPAGAVFGEGVIQPCPGDVTLDGERTLSDSLSLLRHLLQIEDLEGIALSNADTNFDSRVDVADLVRLGRDQVGMSPLAACVQFVPQTAPFIRYLAPKQGNGGTSFTLVGARFSPVAGQNRIFFKQVDEMVEAEVTSASETVLTGIVPPSLELPTPSGNAEELTVPYAVSVAINGEESNDVGFDLSNTPASLEIRPEEAVLLLPPGTGRETVLVSGGVPPYTLAELDENTLANFDVTMTGPVIDIVAKGEQPFGSLRLRVDDSQDPFPRRAFGTVFKRPPSVSLNFEVEPHLLAAGSSPGFNISVLISGMRSREVTFTFEGVEFDSDFLPGQVLALLTIFQFDNPVEFQFLELREVVDGVAQLDLLRFDEAETIQKVGAATFSPEDGTLVIRQLPEPAAESVYDGNITFSFVLSDDLLKLPSGVGESFSVSVDTFSVSVNKGAEISMRGQVRESFSTVAPTSPVRVDRLLPVHVAPGYRLVIRGAGFEEDPALNRTTFADFDGGRVEGEILESSADEITVMVPAEAVSGPLQVEVAGNLSNEFPLNVLFHANAGIAFEEIAAGQATAPTLYIEHPVPLNEFGGDEDEVPLERATITLDQGSSNIAALNFEMRQEVGSLSLLDREDGRVFEHPLLYFGTEVLPQGDGPMRHVFEARAGSRAQALIYFWEGIEGGVVFEVENQITDIGIPRIAVGFDWTISFSEPILQIPEISGSLIETRSVARSLLWSGLLDSNFQVIFQVPVEVP